MPLWCPLQGLLDQSESLRRTLSELVSVGAHPLDVAFRGHADHADHADQIGQSMLKNAQEQGKRGCQVPTPKCHVPTPEVSTPLFGCLALDQTPVSSARARFARGVDLRHGLGLQRSAFEIDGWNSHHGVEHLCVGRRHHLSNHTDSGPLREACIFEAEEKQCFTMLQSWLMLFCFLYLELV